MKTIYHEVLKYSLLIMSALTVAAAFCNDIESFAYLLCGLMLICLIGVVVGE